MKLFLLLLMAGLLSAQTTDWSKPEFWGLKPGSYIPKNENCMGGSFAKVKKHATTDGFDFEVCAYITEVK